MLDEAVKKILRETAQQMVALGKGLLAADESIQTVNKRFDPIGLENTQENRRAFRDMLLTSHGIEQYISGVILHDETVRQQALSGKSFVDTLKGKNILSGIKVDEGLYDMPSSPTEKLTKGLEGLDTRLKEYVKLGATFCKWRAVITVSKTTPTSKNLQQNARDLANYARICQENGLVPIVEPEVLMEGTHTSEQASNASEKILTMLFEELEKAEIFLEGLILKTSMIIAGKESGEKQTPDSVAQDTLAVFKKVLPRNLAGEAFLSGGQKPIQATENLNAMHQHGTLPWPLTFSYARALQDDPTRIWGGKKENIPAAQKAFLHRARMNSLASLGLYTSEMEKELL